jgi:hypothetical protein
LYGVSRDNPDTSADEGGFKVRTNPPDGLYNFVTFAASQRDADGDGIENLLDPCALDKNPNWDPRLQPGSLVNPNPDYKGDTDLDGLPNECDPEPDTQSHHDAGGVFDEDKDRYGNRADNCPLHANSKGQLGGTGADNQEDTDFDGIGDLCDPNPQTADGESMEVCLVSQVKIGAGGPPPDPAPQNMQPCDPNADIPEAGALATPTPSPAPGATPGPDATPTPPPIDSGNGAVGGAETGVGSLAPVASSIPAWATIVSALGGAGLLGSLGAVAARFFGVRLPGRRD